MTFSDFNLDSSLTDGLLSMGFSKPTPIQEQAIPIILSGKDLIACAQTGTGKTAAYLLPVLHHIASNNDNSINTLIVAPTRELALQIDQQIEAIGYFANVSSIAVYGGGDGMAWEQQKRALKGGTNIVIATPGRLISMLAAGDIKLQGLKHLILDEADRMLDMGFNEDILKIISYLPKQRQTLLFSATMPPKIRALAQKILNNPEEVNIAISKPAEGILQQAYLTYDTQKIALMRHILKNADFSSVIIFCSTKEKVKALDRELHRAGLSVEAFHSDLEQAKREEIMLKFKNRQIRILIGTDILSRGIDVEGISLVVNFDAPPDPEDYIHRIGRTARAETTGTAITFVNELDQRKFASIESLIGKEVPKIPLPEFLGAGPEYKPLTRHSASNKPNTFRRNKFPQKRNPGSSKNN
jgi:ATP-dependent RNA helicase RhlE